MDVFTGNLPVQQDPAAVSRRAITCVINKPPLLEPAGQMQMIIVHKLRALGNLTQRANENPTVLFKSLAIRMARVIGKLRRVSALRCVQQPAVFQRENNGMMRVGIVLVDIRQRVRRHPLARVFDDGRPLRDIRAREQPPAMHLALLDEPVFASGRYWHNCSGSLTLIGSRM